MNTRDIQYVLTHEKFPFSRFKIWFNYLVQDLNYFRFIKICNIYLDFYTNKKKELK